MWWRVESDAVTSIFYPKLVHLLLFVKSNTIHGLFVFHISSIAVCIASLWRMLRGENSVLQRKAIILLSALGLMLFLFFCGTLCLSIYIFIYISLPQVAVFFGGLPIKKDEETLKRESPHIVVGTPGRILALSRNKSLNLRHIKHFILDECDKMLEQLGERLLRNESPVPKWTI